MTEYGHFTKHSTPIPLLSHNSIQEKKAVRKKLLEQIERRRRENYKKFYQRLGKQPVY